MKRNNHSNDYQGVSETLYYMATIVHALWLAAERALFSCNDRALWKFFSARQFFELWVKATSEGAKKQQKKQTKYNYLSQ